MEIEPYYSDQEVARLLDPGGRRIKARSIRSEREAGRLVGTKVAGKWMTRHSDLLSFLEAARKCQDQTPDPGSSLSVSPDGRLPGSTSATPRRDAASGMERVFLPPILTRPRPISKTGSAKPPAPGETAQVIPIKSKSPT
jgi:hypothetical protein